MPRTGHRVKPKEIPPEPWERQDGEGPQAFRCFCAYRDSGANGAKRSLTKTAQSLTKRDGSPYSPGTLKQWSRQFNWQERVTAWDEEMDRQTREELAKGITSMRKNHADIARAMLAKALKAMQGLPAEEMTPADIVRMVDIASKLERMSRGEATERIEGKQTIAGEVSLSQIDLSKITKEELAALDEIVGKISTE